MDRERAIPGDDGIQGPPGPPGPPGLLGPSGTPNQHVVVVSPTEHMGNIDGSTTFHCTTDGNHSPRIELRFEGRNLFSGYKYSISDNGTLIINLN